MGERMRILTVTTQTANNYGAVLQAYALQQTLLNLGYENELLHHEREQADKRPISLKARIRNLFLSFFSCIRFKKIKSFNNGFGSFRENHLISTKFYNSISEIQKDPPEADCYLTGSDQVFALGDPLVPLRFLEFCPMGAIKVSYAASLGSYDPNQNDIKQLKQKLETFKRISVREIQGASFIEENVGYPCQIHIDPVFLLTIEQWNEIIKPPKLKDDYILCFPMLGNPSTSKILKKLKKETGLKVVSLQSKSVKTVKADKYIFDASPEEFLGFIKHASFVVTTSFHATAFSILFQIPFYSLVGDYKPERAHNICRLMGLDDRVISPKDTDIQKFYDIDFSNTSSIIDEQRKIAFSYLSELEDLVSESGNNSPIK